MLDTRSLWKRSAIPIVLTLGLLSVNLEGTEARLYNLSRVPFFDVGNRIESKSKLTSCFRIIGWQQAIVKGISVSKTIESMTEVIEADKEGRVLAVRYRVSKATARYSAESLMALPQTKDVALNNVLFVAQRIGPRFVSDTSSIASETTQTLTASQLHLLKSLMRENLEFPGYSEHSQRLLPRKLVPVGYTWKVPAEEIREWIEGDSQTKRSVGTANGAQLELAGVTDGVACVKGLVQLELCSIGAPKVVDLRLRLCIDTHSGVWLDRGFSVDSAARAFEGNRLVIKIDAEKSLRFYRGEGNVATRQPRLNDLGWEPVSEDTNTYKDPANGFSISLPREFTLERSETGTTVFAGKEGVSVKVVLVSNDVPLDVPEAFRKLSLDLRKPIWGSEFVEEERVLLIGGMPAVLVSGREAEGRTCVLTLVAVCGTRIVYTSAKIPVVKSDLIQEVRKAMSTLRVFPPEPRSSLFEVPYH